MKTSTFGILLAISVGLITPTSSLAHKLSNLDQIPGLQSFFTQESPYLLALNSSSKLSTHPSRVSHFLQMGIQNYNKSYIAKALGYFEKATQQNPNDESSWLWLARAYQKQGTPSDFEKAKSAFQKVLSINSNNTEALSNLGELWSWDLSKRTAAIQLLKHAYDLNPADTITAKRLSEALFWQGDSVEALRYATPIAARYQSDLKFMGDYAQMLSQSGKADQALILYNTVLKNESNQSTSIQLNLARALLKDGQLQKAQTLYATINQSAQNTKLAHQDDFIQAMASFAFDSGLYSDAIQWDQRLSSALQRQKDIQLRMARSLTRVSRTPEAIEKFQRLYESGLLTPDEKIEYADYLHHLNLEASALPSPNIIETLYQEAFKEEPENGEISVRLARIYGDQEDGFQKAVQAYQQALASQHLNNLESTKREFLDFIKSNKTQPAEVDKLFQQLLAATPEDISIKTAYAEFLSWQNDRRAEALRHYIDLAKAHPEQKDMWEARLSEVLRWHKPTTDLIPVYQEIVNLYPQSKPIWLTVARAYRDDKN